MVRAKGSFSSSTFTPVSSVPITLDSKRTFFNDPYEGSSKWAHCASQPPMVFREISTPCRSKIFSCRCSGSGYRVLADGWFLLTTKPAELRSFYPGADTDWCCRQKVPASPGSPEHLGDVKIV